MEWLSKLVEYADKHKDGLGVLYTLLGGAVVGILFTARPVLSYLFQSKKEKDDTSKTVINVTTLSVEAIRELISGSTEISRPPARSDTVVPSTTGIIPSVTETVTEQDVLSAVATLSQFRALLKPSKPLTPEVFPKGMRVIKFEPEKLLVIAFDSSAGEKGCYAAFSVVHWTIFPGMAGAFLGQVLAGDPGSRIGFFIGAAAGIINWFRLSRRGPYIKIDFQKKSYSLISVAAASWYQSLPVADINTVYENDQWISTARIAGHAVATRTSIISHVDAEKEFHDFVRALNWGMRNRVSVAEGVFIEPPKREEA